MSLLYKKKKEGTEKKLLTRQKKTKGFFEGDYITIEVLKETYIFHRPLQESPRTEKEKKTHKHDQYFIP